MGELKYILFFVSDQFSAQGDLLYFPDFVSLKGATISLRDYNKVIKSQFKIFV